MREVLSRESNPLPVLYPGDVLLYYTNWSSRHPLDVVDIVIAVKTWSDVAHVEIYEGDYKGINMSSAARAQGVGVYPFRRDGLVYVRRPRTWPDTEQARKWVEAEALGLPYDWIGLLGFDWPWNHPLNVIQELEKKRAGFFCSEYGTERLRRAQVKVFDEAYPSFKVPPMLFKTTPALETVWSKYP